MKKFLVALWLLLVPGLALAQPFSPTGPPYQFLCTTNIASSWTVAATSTAISGVQGKNIYICGWHASTLNTSTAATTFQLTFTQATTNNNCLTSTPSSNLTPSNGITSTAPSVDHNPIAGIFVPAQATTVVTPSSVCLTVGGVANLQLILYYGQY